MVAGATSHNGATFVRAALAAGDAVVATSRDVDKLESLFGGDHANFLSFQMDLRSEAQTSLAARTAYLRFGRIDVFVNAAVRTVSAPTSELSMSEREYLFQVNVTGQLRLLRAVQPYMQPQGRVINLVSGAPGTRHFAGLLGSATTSA